MPTIKFETNSRIPQEKTQPLTAALKHAVAELTGLGAGDFSVAVAGDRRMKMADSDEPIAHIEIKGIDYPKERARAMADRLCAIVDEHLTIRENKVYIAVVSNRMSMWRVSGGSTGVS